MRPHCAVNSQLFVYIFLLVSGGTIAVHAQTSDADPARLVQTQTQLPSTSAISPEVIEQNYAAASPNGTALGQQATLKRLEKYHPFSLEPGVPISYASN